MAIDISGLNYFMPLFGFLFVFVIVLALLIKTKILGDNKFINILVGFIIAIIFATMTSVRGYVQAVTPWFAVLVIALFFILVIVGLSQQKIEDFVKPWFVWVFVIVLILIFLISAIKVFPFTFSDITDFITTEARIVGAVILLIVAALAAWVIAKK